MGQTSTTNRKMTILMVLYTFLLALGAALPLAASYSPGLAARSDGLEIGGQSQRCVVVPNQQAEAGQQNSSGAATDPSPPRSHAPDSNESSVRSVIQTFRMFRGS